MTCCVSLDRLRAPRLEPALQDQAAVAVLRCVDMYAGRTFRHDLVGNMLEIVPRSPPMLIDRPSLRTDYIKYRVAAGLPGDATIHKGLCWVHDTYRIRYLQIPKAGSSSVRTVLARLGFRWVYNAHLHAADYLRMQSYFTFTFVRDPLRRAFSGFEEAHEIGDTALRWLEGAPNWRSPAYMSAWARKGLPGLYNISLQAPSRMHHALPMVFYTTDVLGVPLRLDFVGRLETLQRDTEQLNALLRRHTGGAFDLGRIGHAHSAAPGQTSMAGWWGSRATAADRAALCSFYASDFGCFGYAAPPECAAAVERENEPRRLGQKWLELLLQAYGP